MTNATSILLAGGAMFVLTGVVPSARLGQREARRTLRAAVVFLVVPVVIGLSISGHRLILEDAEADRARQATETYLEDDEAELRLDGVEVLDEVVVVELTGSQDALGDARELADVVQDAVGRSVPVRVEITPRVVIESE